MAAKGKRPLRALTAGDKIDAIQRVNDGESKASVARDIGVPESTLRGWCKNEDKLRYMSTRHSTPDTDKSSDGDAPPDKRARLASPPPPPPAPAASPPLLDLSPAASAAHAAAAEPVELTRPRAEPPPPADAASVSMSAVSPLTDLHPLAGVGMSFNDIATNLTLIAQLNPGLGALAGSLAGARTLRSVRSPKPCHAPVAAAPASSASSAASAPLNLSDKHRGKPLPADASAERPRARHGKEPPPPPPVDDALWYWLKTQQAMLDLTTHGATLPPAPAPHKEPSRGSPKPPASAAAAAPLAPHLDLNKNTWFWQYYKQFGGAMAPLEEKSRAAAPAQASRDILYSQLTRGRGEAAAAASAAAVEPAKASPPPAASAATHASHASHAKARNVLDNLLFNSNTTSRRERDARDGRDERDGRCNAENEYDGEVADALEHGEKFLAWLEASRDPSVTRLHVHQLRGLLHNIGARAQRKPPPTAAAAAAAPAPDRVSRRK